LRIYLLRIPLRKVKKLRLYLSSLRGALQGVSYYLLAQGYKVSVECPLKVKRAFHPVGHKSDPVDSRQIAEYTYRFQDELIPWQPKEELLEKIRQLLTLREQFVKQQTALKNAIAAYRLEQVQVPLIVKAHREALGQLERQIARIDKELDKLIKEDPHIRNRFDNLKSIPGFGMLLATHLLVMTDNFNRIEEYRPLASFIGIVPYEYRSGTSVYKRPHIRHYGPKTSRKLLRLAAQSVATHDASFRRYYLRKLAEGKAKALVLNNIANKLLKVACAIVRDNTRYIKEHRSIHPMYVKST
jgi:transposase